MFPIANEQGKVIAFTGRTLSTDEKAGPKYLNSPETPIYSKSRVLFNLDKAKEAIRKLDYAILVEGQMDCISVYTAGFHNVIASSGTAFTEIQAKLLGRFSKNIVVNFDPDTAGAAAAERSLALLVSEDFQIKVLTLESGFDPDLYIRRKGVRGLHRRAGAFAEILRLPDRAGAHAVPGAHPGGQGESAELSAAAHSARAQPHCSRRVGQRDLASPGHRFGGAAAGTAPRGRLAFGLASERLDAAAGLTDAERVLIRALASQELVAAAPISNREGQDRRLRSGAAGALRPDSRTAARRRRRPRR